MAWVRESAGGRGDAASTLAAREGHSRAPEPQGASPLRVPERPALAQGVTLAGQMRDSGYRNPPWLLEREGIGYVQVTELLYRIAEQLDGQRSHAEIAQAVSAATGRGVSAENVEQLLATQFLAKGLIPAADGRVVSVPSGRSLLAIRMKTRAIPPNVVDRAASPLKAVFLPPVMLLVLGACAALQVWIFVYHGVASAVHQTFYTSGLALAALALVILAAAVHEFGHAAALKYGGGRPGPMGFGLYLVYPAFYTDVTDNYRLSRLSRLRTDLGGFYFNILFVLALAGLYFVTGWEFLLLVIVIIDFQIVHQLLPFVRLDGYWTLVDLTGLPDFFQQIPAFFRSLIPRWVPGQSARPESPLKWWARLILGAYILITVPLLTFLLLLMAVSLPRVLATAIDAAGQQGEAFIEAARAGDIVGMLLHPLQMLLVLLPVAGAALILSGVVRRLGSKLWRWSEGSPARTAVSAGLAATAGALLILAWVPGIAWPGGGRDGGLVGNASFEPIRADERGTLSDSGLTFVRALGPAPSAQDNSALPTVTPTPTPDETTTASASAMRTSTATVTPSPSPTGTRSPTGTPTPAPATSTATLTPVQSPTTEPSPTGGQP